MDILIGFVLLSNSRHPIPSTRIAVLNMFPFLRAAGFDPQIVFEPEGACETPKLPDLANRLLDEQFDIIFFQKVYGPDVAALAQNLRNSGIRTVYGVCDLVNEPMVDLTDATIVVTDFLKSLYSPVLWEKIHVVHDGIEHPEIVKTSWRSDGGSRNKPLKAVLVTSSDLDHLPVLVSPPDWLSVSIVGRYAPAAHRLQRVREARWQFAAQEDSRQRLSYLRFLANPRIRRVAWQPVDVYAQMRNADIGIIPIDTQAEAIAGMSEPSWKVKSENRLTMKMCVGLPVIATPIPAYEPVIEQGRNGFMAMSQTEWGGFLDALRDPELRRTMGETARTAVLHRFSMQEQACRLIDVLNKLVRARRKSLDDTFS